jgi:hypothetical protein
MSTVEEFEGGFKPSRPSGPQKPPPGGPDWAEFIFQLFIVAFFSVPLFSALRGNWALATQYIVGYVSLSCFFSSLVRLISAATKKLA